MLHHPAGNKMNIGQLTKAFIFYFFFTLQEAILMVMWSGVCHRPKVQLHLQSTLFNTQTISNSITKLSLCEINSNLSSFHSNQFSNQNTQVVAILPYESWRILIFNITRPLATDRPKYFPRITTLTNIHSHSSGTNTRHKQHI